MIKLLDILEEILSESKIVKVPDPILNKLPSIYDYIKSNLEDISSKAPKDFDNPYIPSKFNKILKFKDLGGNDIEVSVGLYNNPKDPGAGRMDTRKDIMLINLAFFGDKEYFLELGEHELVHAMDPKVRDVQLLGREYAKKGAEPTGDRFVLSKSNPNQKSELQKNMEKYKKSPWEFDAFTAPLIKVLAKSYNKPEIEQSKKDFKKSIFRLFYSIRTKSVNDIVNDKDLLKTAWFFSPRPWEDKNWDAVYRDFKDSLDMIKIWSTRPSLYKRFLQRVASEIN